MMLTRMFEAWLGVISSLLVRLYLSFPHAFTILYIEDNVMFWLGVSIAVFDLHEEKRTFIYLKFRRNFFFKDLSRSVGLGASQSFEPLYGDVYSCRLTKKRVSSVFNFLLSHSYLTHIILTSSFGTYHLHRHLFHKLHC